jgi:hypothetical protein
MGMAVAGGGLAVERVFLPIVLFVFLADPDADGLVVSVASSSSS